MTRPRVADVLATEKDRQLAIAYAGTVLPMFWQRRRRERLRVMLLDVIVWTRLDAVTHPLTPEQMAGLG